MGMFHGMSGMSPFDKCASMGSDYRYMNRADRDDSSGSLGLVIGWIFTE